MTTTEPAPADGFRLNVLDPGGRDPAQDFSLGKKQPPDDRTHAPVNFHAYAACTGGAFHRRTQHAIAEGSPVLLLLRGDFKATREALFALQRSGRKVVVSLKETGLHQIARQLSDPKRAARFREVVEAADDCLAATPEALVFYGRGRFIPTPYPLHDPVWDFSASSSQRRGIFIGTREWDVPSRHHLAALVLALELNEPVTVFDQDPKRCRKVLGSFGLSLDKLHILQRRLPYRAYLAEMARHKIVLQADRSAVPGQVAGDALLCRMPCVGGDGAVNRLAFPSICGFGRSLGELKQLAARLLGEEKFYQATVAESQKFGREQLGFDVVARQLADLLQSKL